MAIVLKITADNKASTEVKDLQKALNKLNDRMEKTSKKSLTNELE